MFFTGAMSTQPSRSKAVVEDYKKHKLARSALRRIQELIQGFERDRAADRKLAKIGVIFVLLLVLGSLYWLSSGDSIILR